MKKTQIVFFGSLLILAASLWFFAPSSKQPTMSAPRVTQPTTTNPSTNPPPILNPEQQAPQPKQPVALILYTENQPLPPEWLESWEKKTGIHIDQRNFNPASPDAIPLDGDVYSVSTKWFIPLQNRIELTLISNDSILEKIDPVFQGHSFDIDSMWSRPWRWTPYLIFERKPDAKKNARSIALYPSDLELLTAYKLKELGGAIASPEDPRWSQAKSEAKALLPAQSTDEQACWQALKDGSANVSYLPACLRLVEPREDPAGLNWTAPIKMNVTEGTVIRMELLVVSGKTTHQKESVDFIDYLSSSDIQKMLVDKTGYFSVMGPDIPTAKNSPIHLPDSPKLAWLGHSEYLSSREPRKEQIAPAKPVHPADAAPKAE